jgi:hypothetical protein
MIRRTASDRDQEIIKIAQSVQELAQIFRELNMLVIEQVLPYPADLHPSSFDTNQPILLVTHCLMVMSSKGYDIGSN